MKCKECKNYDWYDRPICPFLFDDEVCDDTECCVKIGKHKGYEINAMTYFSVEKGELLF